jgi:hypothetical protein
MDFLKRLQSVSDQIKPTTVETKTIGSVELLPLFVSHRSEFHRSNKVEGEREFVLLMIAMSLSEKGKRLVDSLNIDEVISMLNPLGSTKDGLDDIYLLYTEANKLSKITNEDVAEAGKN